MTQDSNLYRLPDDIDARSLSPDDSATRDDVMSRTSVSADGGQQFGRQDVEMSVNADANRFSNNDSLNNTSGGGRADWNWQLARDWSGQLGGGRGRSLSGFTNSRFLARDVLETYDYHGAARYELTPHWNLNGSARVSNGTHDTTESPAGRLRLTDDHFRCRVSHRAWRPVRSHVSPHSNLVSQRAGRPRGVREPALTIDRAANFNVQYAFTVKTSLQECRLRVATAIRKE